MANVLIVDDDGPLREALAESARDLGHDVRTASCGTDALLILKSEPIGAVLLDLRMPGMDGLEVLRRIRQMRRDTAVTVLTAHATAANTIDAMRLGAFDHLTKPIGREELGRVLAAMLASVAPVRNVTDIPVQEGLIGSSRAMRAIQKTIGMVADSNATVLIMGETGTGKELAARAIHEHGHRAGKPFIAVNCAAIPGELMETELFGHVRGAFTGATSDRAGAFQQADGGTVFLDEIGDMALDLQAKILRALQERIVTPVGGKPAAVDVRVIAATHRDLQERVSEGSFREDLFYRLHVVPIHLPPLRERIPDIVPLAEHFLQQSPGKTLSADAAATLIKHAWPGNVRELKNAMERTAVLVRGDVIKAVDLDFITESAERSNTIAGWPDEDLPSAVSRLEEMLIRRALQRCSGNRADAARALGIHRQLLYSKLKRYSIDVSGDKTAEVADEDIQSPPANH
jgi:DNA-binding NtrC family response regulator